MSFVRLEKLAAILSAVCSLCPLIPAAGQTAIPFVVELSGYDAIPSNDFGSVICGRFWLDGTNLTYRFGSTLARSPVELREPTSTDTNGPLLYLLNPFGGGFDAYDNCDAAAGIPAGPIQPWENPRRGIPIAQGIIGISADQIPQLLGGKWYAHALSLRPRTHRDGPVFPVRGQILPLDTDADGVPDYLDRCADTPPGSLINSQGCSVEQLCPCDGPWNDHGEYVTSLKQVLEGFVQEGLLDRGQSRLLFQSGALSDCGKRVVAEPHPM